MRQPTIKYSETDTFEKDLKNLTKKRFKTLREDLENAKRDAIELYHIKNIDNQSVFAIPNFGNEKIKIFKIRKFACKSLKGRGAKSGIRVIYAFYPDAFEIDFIEIYFKGDQENESSKRIQDYLKNS